MDKWPPQQLHIKSTSNFPGPPPTAPPPPPPQLAHPHSHSLPASMMKTKTTTTTLMTTSTTTTTTTHLLHNSHPQLHHHTTASNNNNSNHIRTHLQIANDRLASMIGPPSSVGSPDSSDETFAAADERDLEGIMLGGRIAGGNGRAKEEVVVGGVGLLDNENSIPQNPIINQNGKRAMNGNGNGNGYTATPTKPSHPWGPPLYTNGSINGAATTTSAPPTVITTSAAAPGPMEEQLIMGMRGGAELDIDGIGSRHRVSVFEDWSAEAIVQGPGPVATTTAAPSYTQLPQSTVETTTNNTAAGGEFGSSLVGGEYYEYATASVAAADTATVTATATGTGTGMGMGTEAESESYGYGTTATYSRGGQSEVDYNNSRTGGGSGNGSGSGSAGSGGSGGSNRGGVFPQEVEREVLVQVLGEEVLDELCRIGVMDRDGDDEEREGGESSVGGGVLLPPAPSSSHGREGVVDGQDDNIPHRLSRKASTSHASLADTVRSLRREPRDVQLYSCRGTGSADGSVFNNTSFANLSAIGLAAPASSPSLSPYGFVGRTESPALGMRALTPLPPHAEEEAEADVDGISVHEDVEVDEDEEVNEFGSQDRDEDGGSPRRHVSVFREDVEHHNAGVGGRRSATPSVAFGRWRRRKGGDGVVESGEGKRVGRMKRVKQALVKIATKGLKVFGGKEKVRRKEAERQGQGQRGVVEDEDEDEDEEGVDRAITSLYEPTVTRLSVIPEVNESFEDLVDPAPAPQPATPATSPKANGHYRGRSQNVHGPRPLIPPAAVQQQQQQQFDSPRNNNNHTMRSNDTTSSRGGGGGRVVVTLEPEVARFLRDLAFQAEGDGSFAIREQASFVAEQLREMFNGQVEIGMEDDSDSEDDGDDDHHRDGRSGRRGGHFPDRSGAVAARSGRELPAEWYRYGGGGAEGRARRRSITPDEEEEPQTPPPRGNGAFPGHMFIASPQSPASALSGNYSLQLTLTASPIDHLSPTSSGANFPIPSISSSSSTDTDLLLRDGGQGLSPGGIYPASACGHPFQLHSFTPYPEKLAREIMRGDCFRGFDGLIRPPQHMGVETQEWVREWCRAKVMWERGLALEMDHETPYLIRGGRDWWANVRERVEEIKAGGWGVERCVSCLCDDGIGSGEVAAGGVNGGGATAVMGYSMVGGLGGVGGGGNGHGNNTGISTPTTATTTTTSTTLDMRRNSRGAAKAAWDAGRWFSFGESWVERYPDSEASTDDEGGY